MSAGIHGIQSGFSTKHFARTSSFPEGKLYATGDHSSHFEESYQKLLKYLNSDLSDEKLELRKILYPLFI